MLGHSKELFTLVENVKCVTTCLKCNRGLSFSFLLFPSSFRKIYQSYPESFISSITLEPRFTSALVILCCLSRSSCLGPVGLRWSGCGCPYCSWPWPARASPVPSAVCARASLRHWPSSAPRQGCFSCPRPSTGAPWSCDCRKTS